MQSTRAQRSSIDCCRCGRRPQRHDTPPHGPRPLTDAPRVGHRGACCGRGTGTVRHPPAVLSEVATKATHRPDRRPACRCPIARHNLTPAGPGTTACLRVYRSVHIPAKIVLRHLPTVDGMVWLLQGPRRGYIDEGSERPASGGGVLRNRDTSGVQAYSYIRVPATKNDNQ
jgi:hypothetical protein